MRKLIQRLMVATMCMSFVAINPINAFAATETVENEKTTFVATEETFNAEETSQARGTSLTMSIAVGQGYAQSPYMNIGAFSTIKVTGRGNSGMQYRVRIQGTGNSNYQVGYLYADGSTLSKNMWTLPAGQYWIFIEPWSGSTNGQTVYFDVTIS